MAKVCTNAKITKSTKWCWVSHKGDTNKRVSITVKPTKTRNQQLISGAIDYDLN